MKSKTKGYYLAEDVIGWIDDQARADNRPPSNWLETLIRRMMSDEAKDG